MSKATSFHIFPKLIVIAVIIKWSTSVSSFRMASLRWNYPSNLKGPVTFRVRYCELHTWGLHRCRYQTVDEMTARTSRRETSQDDSEPSKDNFIVDIGGLRMSTNYSFQVVPQDLGSKFGGLPSQISLQTKGFSAKASKCLANSTEVSVETFPFFGGVISAESTSPGCYIKGNPQRGISIRKQFITGFWHGNADIYSPPREFYRVNPYPINSSRPPQTKYTLKIRHKECGSLVDGSKVTSVIVVQENIPILTHSTRRFVVVCSFSPESDFVVKAGISLPTLVPREKTVAKAIDFNRLLRIAPQSTNDLPESEMEEQNVAQQHNLQHAPHYVSHLYAEKKHQGRSLEDGMERGMWETFLVLGMICGAVLASMASVFWFVRSYRNVNAAHEETIKRITSEDSESDVGPSIDRGLETSASLDLPPQFQIDDEQVELDFEFSEDINGQEGVDTLNKVTLSIHPQNVSHA